MKDKAGTINASGIANVLLGAVNEALVDGKSSKKGNNSKNQAKVDVQVKGKPDMSEVEAAKKEVTKPVEVPVKLKLDTSEIKELQNLPTAKAKVEFLINKKAVNDIVAKDLNNVINKAAKKMNSKLQGITSESMASLASLDKFLPNIPELSSSKHRAMMTELKKKGLSDISQNERAQIESAYRLRSYLLDSKKEMSERGKFIPPSESLVAPDASLSLEDYNKALNGLIKTSKNIVIASDLFEQLNKQLETNKRNIPVEQDVSSKTMRRLLGMGIKKNDPDYDPNNYAQYLLNQSLNKAGFSDDIDKIVAHQTHKIELGITSSHLDTIFKKSQNEGLPKKDYSKLVDRYINKSLAELEKDILSDDQFGEIALGSISDIKKKAETLNDSLKARRKNKFIGLMSTYLAKGGSGINNEEFYKALLSDISEYDKDIDAGGKQKAIEQAVQKQLTEQKAAENKEEKSVPKKTTRKRTVKKKESIPTQTDVEEKDVSTSTPATAPANESKSQPTKPKAKKVSKTTTSKPAKSKEKEAQELLDQLGSLEGELMRAYDEYIDKKEAYKNGKSPFQYANAREKYRTTYIKMLAAQLPASSFKNITGKDPFSILKAKSLYDHAYNTSRQIFGIKDSLHDLGYTRDAYPEMFDSLDGMARKIIAVNDMRYNNRNNPNGDTYKIAQVIRSIEFQATQLEDTVRADGHSGFTLKGIPSIQEPSKGNISKPKSQPALENEEEKQIKQSKDVAKAKKKEADAVVAANDKIADSEKVVSNQIDNTTKIQKDAIKTVTAIRNEDYGLTETPVNPSELDGLKQLSQKEFGDAQKYVKVYKDANRTIYTLTQTYEKKFDQNGNLLAEGYKNAISYYDSYEKLENDAIKLSKRINNNYAKLDTEKYKSTDKQNPNLIKKLQGDIKSDQQDLSELHRIARLQASDSANDYTYQDFTQALRKGSAESSRALSSTRRTNRDNFDAQKETVNTDLSKQISEVENLGQAGEIAASKLKGIQQALSGITTPAGLESAKKQIDDINKQFDSNKAREAALNYVNNLEKGLTGKQTVSIGQKDSNWYENSVKDGKWTGPLADLNNKFETNYQSTSAKLDGYIADAKKLGDVGKEAGKSFSDLKKNLKTCYTESGLKQIQDEMKVTQDRLTASKKQADEQAATLKNSAIAKQYDNIIDKAKEVKDLNAELLGYKKKQAQYSEDSQTYKNIGDRITETTEAAKKANSEFEELSKDNFVYNNSEQLKAAGKNVEDYEKTVREMKQAQDNVTGFDDKASQAKNSQAFSEQYTDAIARVKELKAAIQDLYSFQEKGVKGQITSDEFVKGVSDRVKNINSLKDQVKEFRKNIYSKNSNNKDGVLNDVLFGNYEETFSDYEDKVSSYNDNIANLMVKAYSRQRKLSNDLYKMVGKKDYSEQEYNDKWNQANTAQATYEALKAQVLKTSSNTEEIQKIFSGVKNSADLDRNNILGGLQTSLEQQINDFDNSLKHMQNTMDLPNGIATLRDKLKEAFTFEDGVDNIGNFKNRMQEFYQSFDALKGNSFIQFANEFGTSYDKLTKAENSSNKVSAYTDKLNGFVESYNNIISSFHDGKIDTNQAQKEISDLAAKMQDFQKVAKDYDKTNSKGTYVEASKGQVQDAKDVQTMLTEYAKSIGLTSQLSSNINETTGQVKMQFADISGNVVTLTGNLEKAGNAMRVMASTASKSSSGMTSFGNSIKGLVSGNFKGAIADIASYVSYFQVTMKAIQAAKQGFNTFLDYEKDLTNISYTMNMSPDQLQNLGTSAIDMAKDLSMSLNNTMDIYKIYANMNTTASEIQETAKPTAILSNLSGVDASTAADQVQGILQQFHMLEDGSTTAADASMHIVDVLDKVSGSVGIDYAKGIKIISDAVQASGQVAYDAGMSYEQLAAITAKVSERTREDGSSIGNALKTIITRTTKVGKMPQYADEVDNATLSNASASLHAIGVDVYNPDGSDRGIITVMSELKDKWDDLTDAQQAKIAFDVAATRQTSKFKSMLDAFTDSMSLAEEATTANGNAEANQEKYMESTAGRLQAIKTQMQDFWVNFYNSDTVNGVLDFVHSLTEGFTSLEKTLGPIPALLTAVFAAMTVKNATMAGLRFLSGDGLTKVVG